MPGNLQDRKYNAERQNILKDFFLNWYVKSILSIVMLISIGITIYNFLGLNTSNFPYQSSVKQELLETSPAQNIPKHNNILTINILNTPRQKSFRKSLSSEILKQNQEPNKTNYIAEFSPKSVNKKNPKTTILQMKDKKVFSKKFNHHKNLIAIVIDDLGIDQQRTQEAISLLGPLTLGFLPYGYNLSRHINFAKNKGHEIILHLPMEPISQQVNPGPNALMNNLKPEEIRRRITWNLSQFNGYVGINNHMGSKFTKYETGMLILLAELKKRNLFFLDSLTSPQSVAKNISIKANIKYLVRDIFLDNVQSIEGIRKRLNELEMISHKRGYAIGIAHPYDITLKTLSNWLKKLDNRRFELAPLSKILQIKYSFP